MGGGTGTVGDDTAVILSETKDLMTIAGGVVVEVP
jgi:hypothetical protein